MVWLLPRSRVSAREHHHRHHIRDRFGSIQPHHRGIDYDVLSNGYRIDFLRGLSRTILASSAGWQCCWWVHSCCSIGPRAGGRKQRGVERRVALKVAIGTGNPKPIETSRIDKERNAGPYLRKDL